MKLVDCQNTKLLFVMAVAVEYGAELQKRFEPLFTGVGPVEAAAATAAALARLEIAGNKPDLLVSVGSAGSRVLEQTGVYQASSVSYRDMDATPLGFAKGVTPFLDLPARLDCTVRVPDIEAATLSTGGNIVSGEGYESTDAEMVDMESYACLRAAMLHGLPLVVLRGISDGATELRHIDGWTEYLHVIDQKLAIAVDRLMSAIRSCEISI
jgi:adenosylhomocysteine nucleosidase